MHRIQKLLGAAALALGLTTTPGLAVVLNVDEAGQLMGASGVRVEGGFYDVAFRDGSCVSLYSGCDGSTFAFDFDGALAAAKALLSQVFIDGPDGMFDSKPDLTNAMTNPNRGVIYTPRLAVPSKSDPTTGQLSFVATINTSDYDFTISGVDSNWTFDTTGSNNAAYAVWTRVAPVPLPAGGLLLLSGLGAFAAVGLRRKRIVDSRA